MLCLSRNPVMIVPYKTDEICYKNGDRFGIGMVWVKCEAMAWLDGVCVCVSARLCADGTQRWNEKKRWQNTMRKRQLGDDVHSRQLFFYLFFLVYFTWLVMNDYILCKTIKTWNSTRGIIFVWAKLRVCDCVWVCVGGLYPSILQHHQALYLYRCVISIPHNIILLRWYFGAIIVLLKAPGIPINGMTIKMSTNRDLSIA